MLSYHSCISKFFVCPLGGAADLPRETEAVAAQSSSKWVMCAAGGLRQSFRGCVGERNGEAEGKGKDGWKTRRKKQRRIIVQYFSGC